MHLSHDGASAAFSARELIHSWVTAGAVAGRSSRGSSCYHHTGLMGYGSPIGTASTHGLPLANELQKGSTSSWKDVTPPGKTSSGKWQTRLREDSDPFQLVRKGRGSCPKQKDLVMSSDGQVQSLTKDRSTVNMKPQQDKDCTLGAKLTLHRSSGY
ncbi:hypothetical protein CB1_056579089 [Camelus ferus]|nr:hypothetical protein CB1_056579089 [Camelus ferus]